MNLGLLQNLCIYIVTWNVGTKFPDSITLNNLLGLSSSSNNLCPNSSPDLYVIGLQEVNVQPQNQVLGIFKDDPWTSKLKGILKNGDYVAVKTEQMQGLLLIIFSKRKHLLHLRDIEAQYTRTGLGGLWGNKGGVSIRMNLYGCGITFMNSHLAAHDSELAERIVDYKQILDNHHYHVKRFREIFDHDYVFWFGDLNFRLQYEDDTTPEMVRDLINKEKLHELIERDQLNLVRREGKAFYQLEEREPAFPPTFKFETGTSKYNMKRRPAWTDRILWKVQCDSYTNVKLGVEQLSYKSHPGYSISDHKPVSSEFIIKIPSSDNLLISNRRRARSIELIDAANMTITNPDFSNSQAFESPIEYNVEFIPIPIWYLGDEHTIEFIVPHLFEEQNNDWIGIYKSDYSSLSEYIAYEYTNQADTKKTETNNLNHKQIRMEFPESIDLIDGESYVMLYISNTGIRGITSVAGISNVFKAEKRPSSPRFEAVD